MKATIEKIEKAIENVINGIGTQYIKFYNGDDMWTVRVSNHGANPSRVTENFISLVVEVPEKNNDDEAYSSLSNNKKSFSEIDNQFYLDEYGSFTENFYDIEECLEYIIN